MSGEPPERDDSPTSAQRELEARIREAVAAALGRHAPCACVAEVAGARRHYVVAIDPGGAVAATEILMRELDGRWVLAEPPPPSIRGLAAEVFRAGYDVEHVDLVADQALSVGYALAKASGPRTRIRPKRCVKCNAIVSADQQRCPMCGSRRVR